MPIQTQAGGLHDTSSCSLLSFPTETHIAAASAGTRPLPSSPWTVCKYGGGWQCFLFACRRGKPLGVERWVKVPTSLGAEAPSKVRLGSLLCSSAECMKALSCAEDIVQTLRFLEEALTLTRDLFHPDPALVTLMCDPSLASH